MSKLIKVAVGIVTNRHQQFLVTQRPSSKNLAGYWEFPGGKIEPGETTEEGLARELREELDLVCDSISRQSLFQERHVVNEQTIELDVRHVLQWHGEIAALEGQAYCWKSLEEIDGIQMLESNWPIVRILAEYFD